MNFSDTLQICLVTLIATMGLYLASSVGKNMLFPNTDHLIDVVKEDLRALEETHPEVAQIHFINIEGAKGDRAAQGWALFLKEAFCINKKADLSADILLISQEPNKAIVQMTINGPDNNFVKEIARTYSF